MLDRTSKGMGILQAESVHSQSQFKKELLAWEVPLHREGNEEKESRRLTKTSAKASAKAKRGREEEQEQEEEEEEGGPDKKRKRTEQKSKASGASRRPKRGRS